MKRIFKQGLALAAMALLSARAGALQVKPTYQIFTVEPGDEVRGELVLTNTEEADITVTPEVKEWYAIPANEGIRVHEWLKVLDSTFTFKPGESRTINFSAKAPKK